jgi:hypothetical protein
LSLSGSKLGTYVLPLFPALALLMARWCAVHADSPAGRNAIGASAAVALLLSAALPVILFVLRASVPLYEGVSFSAGFSALLVLLIIFFAVLLSRVGRRGATMDSVVALGCGAAVLWMGFSTQADRLLVEEGASVRPLTDIVKRMPGADAAQIFALGVRHNGLEFYLQRFVSRSVEQSDIVLPPDLDQRRRVIDSVGNYFEALGNVPAVGIVNLRDLEALSATWHVLGRSGRCALVANDASLQRRPVAPPPPPD